MVESGQQDDEAFEALSAAAARVAELLREHEARSLRSALSLALAALAGGTAFENAPILTEHETIRDATWSQTVEQLPPESAELVSRELAAASERLTELFRALGRDSPEGLRIRDAIGFLYTDVLRPLWRRFGHLAPFEHEA
jgi:hypothetical protein